MSGTEVYQYDSLGNLVIAFYPDGRTAQFVYDNADNRTQASVTLAVGGSAPAAFEQATTPEPPPAELDADK